MLLQRSQITQSKIKIMSERPSPTMQSLEVQWHKIRQKIGTPQQALDQNQGIELIQQWILHIHQSQFESYEKQVKEGGGKMGLREIVEEVVKLDKQSNYLVTQKYTFERTNILTDKVREKYKQIVKEMGESQQEPVEINPEPQRQQSPTEQPKPQFPQQLAQLPEGYSPVRLPSIRNRGKVYNPEEMASYFQLSEEAYQQYNLRSPHMFQTKQKLQISNRAKIFNNKYLKMAFQKFCQQSYKVNGLFSELLMQADKMNLNKWMVFCKEFDFNKKFHIKHLIEIYQQATKFCTTMDLQQFLMAVAMLQQKYMDKFHKGEDFVEEVLNINSQAALRIKMQNRKVSYGGPTKNFFQQGTYSQQYRKDEAQKQSKFKVKKKQRDIVLIKGMYQEHIKEEVKRLKDQRQKNNKSRTNMPMNRSMVEERNHVRNASTGPVNHQGFKPEGLGYSKVFHIKQQTARKTTNTSLSRSPETTQMYKTEALTQRRDHITQKSLELSHTNTDNLRKSKVEPEPERSWMGDSGNPSTWLTRIRSDSEQSDQILKQHLQLQRKLKNKTSSKDQGWKKDMQAQSRRVSQIQKKIEQQDDLAQTGANFKPQISQPWRPYIN